MMNKLYSQVLGKFNPFTMRKDINVFPNEQLLGDLNNSQGIEPMERDRIFAEYHKKLNGKEKDQFLFFTTTDFHESHHYHSMLFSSYGIFLFHLVLQEMKSFAENIIFELSELTTEEDFIKKYQSPVISSAYKVIMDYLFKSDWEINKITRESTKWEKLVVVHANTEWPTQLPAFMINGRPFILTLPCVFESWTWATERALASRQFNGPRFKHYFERHSSETPSEYNIVEVMLTNLFGHAYNELNYLQKGKLISIICQHCAFYIDRKIDISDRNFNPGWQLYYTFDSLYHVKEKLLERLMEASPNIDEFDKFISRNETHAVSNGKNSMLDEIAYILDSKSTDHAENSIEYALNKLKNDRIKIFESYLTNPNIFKNPIEYLHYSKYKYIPPVPMATYATNDGERFFAFPQEGEEQAWFSWYILSELLVGYLASDTRCPVLIHNAILKTSPCNKQEDCNVWINIYKKKTGICYLHNALFLAFPQ